ncbi:MAG: hypothetical protein NTX11_01550 [Candidatus Saccharibacteria bacterium]|nr:hypothetical protein [Candidatus Saccharibacteria bacterium]
MLDIQNSAKRVQVTKAQATAIATIAGAVFITVFSLVSSKSLWTQRAYQARVIDKKEKARVQLEDNINAVSGLVTSYKNFISNPTNLLGGSPSGTGEKDGDNARLILDALPSKYDFPALTTSLEKLLVDRKFKIDGITGTDDELAQAKAAAGDSKTVEMPFQVSVTGNGTSIQDLLVVLEKSIRPFQATKLTLKGGTADLKLVLDAKTYYQPEKTLNIKQETVK